MQQYGFHFLKLVFGNGRVLNGGNIVQLNKAIYDVLLPQRIDFERLTYAFGALVTFQSSRKSACTLQLFANVLYLVQAEFVTRDTTPYRPFAFIFNGASDDFRNILH